MENQNWIQEICFDKYVSSKLIKVKEKRIQILRLGLKVINQDLIKYHGRIIALLSSAKIYPSRFRSMFGLQKKRYTAVKYLAEYYTNTALILEAMKLSLMLKG